MDTNLLLRLFFTLVIILTGIVAYIAINKITLARAADKYRGLNGFKPGIPAILYFTTPTCAPCKTVQRPAIQELQQTMGDSLQVIEVDASEQTDLADYWGVLSVPTTFIIDSHGQPRHINHGVTRAEKLREQLSQITSKIL